MSVTVELETIEPSVPLLNIGTALSGLPFLYKAYIDGVPCTLVMDTGAVLGFVCQAFVLKKRVYSTTVSSHLCCDG
jgi:hypothetical protein